MTQNLLIKPTGPNCSLDCNYCFYLEKEALYPGKNRMDLSTAENMIAQMMGSGDPVTFSWQGGEPTLMGLEFFQRVTIHGCDELPIGVSLSDRLDLQDVVEKVL